MNIYITRERLTSRPVYDVEHAVKKEVQFSIKRIKKYFLKDMPDISIL